LPPPSFFGFFDDGGHEVGAATFLDGLLRVLDSFHSVAQDVVCAVEHLVEFLDWQAGQYGSHPWVLSTDAVSNEGEFEDLHVFRTCTKFEQTEALSEAKATNNVSTHKRPPLEDVDFAVVACAIFEDLVNSKLNLLTDNLFEVLPNVSLREALGKQSATKAV